MTAWMFKYSAAHCLCMAGVPLCRLWCHCGCFKQQAFVELATVPRAQNISGNNMSGQRERRNPHPDLRFAWYVSRRMPCQHCQPITGQQPLVRQVARNCALQTKTFSNLKHQSRCFSYVILWSPLATGNVSTVFVTQRSKGISCRLQNWPWSRVAQNGTSMA